jgi:hypothetical protein
MSAQYAAPCHYRWSPPDASWCGSRSEGCPLPYSTDVHSRLGPPSQTVVHLLWLQHLNISVTKQVTRLNDIVKDNTLRGMQYMTGYLTHYKAVVTEFNTYFNTQELSNLPPKFSQVIRINKNIYFPNSINATKFTVRIWWVFLHTRN